MVSNKISSGEKNANYFIGYLHNDYKVKPLHITLPKPRACVKSYDSQTKWVYFLIEDDELLEKYNTIWSALILRENLIANMSTINFFFENQTEMLL